MTYKEILRMYKKGELGEEQAKRINSEIEKHEAISEYLFDNVHIPEFSDMEVEKESYPDENNAEEIKFLKMIKKTIRRAFIKAGVVVAVVVLSLVLTANIALPYIVDGMYYNPSAVAGEENGIQTNKMSVDTAVYTELFTPGYYRTKVNVTRNGYGEYDVHIPQTVGVNGQFRDVYGRIEKGRLALYSDGFLKSPVSNAFVTSDIQGVLSSLAGTGAAGDKETMLRKLKELDESDCYVGFITFDKVMTYDELTAWSKKTGIIPEWCAVCRLQDVDEYVADDIVGFNYISSGEVMGYDKEEYPYLNYGDLIGTVDNFPEDTISAENMETHFISMLRYVKDNSEFKEMAGNPMSEAELNMYIDSVANHGLSIYGFTVVAQRDRLLEISTAENVEYIYTEALY